MILVYICLLIFDSSFISLLRPLSPFVSSHSILVQATRGDYASALTALSKTEVSSPIYFIVGGAGAGEGAVVTRDEQPEAKVCVCVCVCVCMCACEYVCVWFPFTLCMCQ